MSTRSLRESGTPAVEQLDLDRSTLQNFRRVFVSNPDLVGRKLADLDCPRRFGAMTRVRHGDIGLLAFWRPGAGVGRPRALRRTARARSARSASTSATPTRS